MPAISADYPLPRNDQQAARGRQPGGLHQLQENLGTLD
jgi:hypothetical protein